MNIMIWLVVGGMIGWLASVLLKTDSKQGFGLNVVVGLVGALVAGLAITPMVGEAGGNQNDFSFPTLLVPFVGAIVLLLAVNLFRRGVVR